MNVNQLLESANPYKSVLDDAARLTAKWGKSGLLEGYAKDEATRMAVLLENQAKQLVIEGNITGGTNSMSGGAYHSENWAGVALPLVRRIFDDISSKDFISTQPMNLPSGLVFYLDFKFGNTKQPQVAGTSLYSADPITNITNPTKGLYGAGKFGYSINNATASVTVVTGSVGFADVNFDSNYQVTGSYQKITLSGTTYSAASGSFDKNGVRAFIVSGSGIDPQTVQQQFTKLNPDGTLSLIVSGAAATPGTAVLFYNKQTTPDARGDYEDGSTFNQTDVGLDIPSIDVSMKSDAIVAKTRRLKAQWSPEFSQDLNAYHSIDAESELTGMLSQYISMEVDLELIDMLIQNAYTIDYWSAKNNTFYNSATNSFTTGTDVANGGYYNSQGQWFQTLGTKLQKVSNKIHQLTVRGGANFMMVSPTVSTVLESIAGFAADGDGDKTEYNFGIQKVGSLNSRYKVYKNPYMTENVILMGFKGQQFLDCGAVYAPYVPLIMTPLIHDPETFTPRKGLMTRYAKKMIRPDYYGKVYVHGLDTI